MVDGQRAPVAHDLAARAEDLGLAPAGVGEALHLMGHGHPALEAQVHHLVVHRVVVAGIDAPAVRPLAQHLLHRRVALLHEGIAPILALQVNLPRRERAPALHRRRAIQAPRRRALGPVRRVEERRLPEARDARAPAPPQPPHELVEVVAALLQDHRRGALGVPPVPPAETVRRVHVPHLLQMLDAHHLADRPFRDEVVDLPEIDRVTQHVPHHHQAIPLLAHLPGQRLARGPPPRHRFLQKQVMARVQARHGRLQMRRVGHRDHHHVAIRPRRHSLRPIPPHRPGPQAMRRRHRLRRRRVDVRHPHHARLVRVRRRVRGIRPAAVARAQNHQTNRRLHRIAPNFPPIIAHPRPPAHGKAERHGAQFAPIDPAPPRRPAKRRAAFSRTFLRP